MPSSGILPGTAPRDPPALESVDDPSSPPLYRLPGSSLDLSSGLPAPVPMRSAGGPLVPRRDASADQRGPAPVPGALLRACGRSRATVLPHVRFRNRPNGAPPPGPGCSERPVEPRRRFEGGTTIAGERPFGSPARDTPRGGASSAGSRVRSGSGWLQPASEMPLAGRSRAWVGSRRVRFASARFARPRQRRSIAPNPMLPHPALRSSRRPGSHHRRNSPTSPPLPPLRRRTRGPAQAGRGRNRRALRRPSLHLRPAEIARHLDRFVIGQTKAKRVLSVALCDHFQHVHLTQEGNLAPYYQKQNVLLLGPTGVGQHPPHPVRRRTDRRAVRESQHHQVRARRATWAATSTTWSAISSAARAAT